MNWPVLKDELANDPLRRGYPGMSDVQVADSLNTADRSRIKASMSGDEVFACTDATEFSGVSDHKRSQWLAFCGRDGIDPGAAPNVDFVKWVFGDSSTTVSNLDQARQESISRATELGIGKVLPGDVQMARAM